MIAFQHNPVADTPVIRIRPASDRLANGLKELWQYRELLYFLIWRDVKVRYKQTAIGAAWAIIQPLMTMIIFTMVFGKFANMPSDGLPYPIFTFAALLPWTYFSKALSQSVSSVVADANLITKVYFPRLLLPLAAVVGGLIDFAIAFVFLLGMMAWYGLAPHSAILLLPFFVLLTMLTALSVSVWLSVINVRYRDVGQAIPFLVQIWLFASPVAYPASVVPENWRFLYNLNPLAGIIEGFRWALLGSQNPPIVSLLSTAAVVLALLYGGIVFFKRMEKTFADVV
jgi:lipopolysaccharide transport system permease protein